VLCVVSFRVVACIREDSLVCAVVLVVTSLVLFVVGMSFACMCRCFPVMGGGYEVELLEELMYPPAFYCSLSLKNEA
jgi:hypothetical protein